ncbi:N-methylhydantoinase B [Balnearium lithotrophicum]|uniref:N-methylhydantoinase B n=1 Tax=Balnearium lithotrophicum TaxID=223788 RepID=A0A521BVS3_9BACT|nr:hydantoinase B/oxoprolinase family protein [Balnearium lithotrophicum]SMO51292.1 N-methylhydantoinase B [Balnearium lithotrophicum]
MVNPLKIELFKNALSSVAEEMGAVLQRTAFSPNIKERRDFSCALFDRHGRLIAQAAHIPVHLGSMPMSVRSVVESLELNEGDVAVINDPFKGGTHLPDITVVSPVYYRGELLFYVANRAHHSDVGGITPGSMPISTSIFQEGLVIPPFKCVEGGKVREEFIELLKSNTRTPEEREGDFRAQLMANRRGEERLKELLDKYSPEVLEAYSEALLDYSERKMRGIISEIPDGTYTYGDFLDSDGFSETPVRIRVILKIDGSSAVVDFSPSDPQVRGCLNGVRSIAVSATLYVFRCLSDEDIPTNEGILRPIEVITKRRTVVDSEFPSAVSGGNVETSQRLVDVLIGALSKAIPEKVPAASQGTMNNVTFGGKNERGEDFTYYETVGGGAGALKGADGESAVQTHMTNTLNTPVEVLEYQYPLMVTEYSIRENSGGGGIWKGGDGIVREFLFLGETEVTVLSERRKFSPYGLEGGRPGKRGVNILIDGEGRKKELPSKFTRLFKPGERLRIETPGGGGYGRKL